jgi:4'-phosphopantetheinyl transferase EntD
MPTISESRFWPPDALFPFGACAEFASSDREPPELPTPEAMAIAGAVPSRQREFALGRECARRALSRLGEPLAIIPMGIDRGPCWPKGIVGSITHCKGFVGAVVENAHRLCAIGFDAERAEPLESDLVPLVCTTDETAWVGGQRSAPVIDWPKIIFSAKESVHKCISPLSGRMLDFLDVTLVLDAAAMTFTVAAARPSSAIGLELERIRGRMAVNKQFVFTCAYVEPISR